MQYKVVKHFNLSPQLIDNQIKKFYNRKAVLIKDNDGKEIITSKTKKRVKISTLFLMI